MISHVIDDHGMLREFCRDLLEHGGYEVEEAANGTIVLELYRRNPAGLAITDIVMQERNMNGFEVVRTLRRLSGPANGFPICAGFWYISHARAAEPRVQVPGLRLREPGAPGHRLRVSTIP